METQKDQSLNTKHQSGDGSQAFITEDLPNASAGSAGAEKAFEMAPISETTGPAPLQKFQENANERFNIVAVVDLEDEEPTTTQEFLFHVYPSECLWLEQRCES